MSTRLDSTRIPRCLVAEAERARRLISRIEPPAAEVSAIVQRLSLGALSPATRGLDADVARAREALGIDPGHANAAA